MRLPVKFSLLLALGAMGLLLTACGDPNGFGNLEGWGGYTKGFGDVDEGMDNSVGLCSYTGGCMPEQSDDGVGANSQKATKSARSSTDAGSPDGGQ